MDISNYISGVTQNITNKLEPKSISATTVGNALSDLAVLTSNSINQVESDFLPVKEYVNDYLKSFIQFGGESPLLVHTKASGNTPSRKIIEVDSDLAFTAYKYASESIPGSALKPTGITTDKLSTDVTSRMWQPLDPATGYILGIFVTDSLGRKRALALVDTENTWHFPKLDFTLADGAISINKLTPDLQTKINSGGVNNFVIAYGDSLTAGTGGGGTTYLNVLSGLMGSGYTYINCGVGGENVPTIAARQGGVPALIKSGFTLPADSTTEVEISSVANPRLLNSQFNGEITPLKQGVSTLINPAYVQNIACTLRWTGTGSTDPNGTYVIKRNVAITGSTGTTIIPNSLLITSSARLYRTAFLNIFFIGQNAGYANEAELVEYYKRMIEYAKANKYVLIGLHSGTPSSRAALEKAMTDAFGLQYINWREYISTYALGDLGITPTSDDLNDMAQGRTPHSLWSSPTDSIHLNASGYTALGRLIYNRITQLGYI